MNYATAHGHGVLHFYAGYVSLLPNLVDTLSVRLLALPAVPFVQAYFGLFAAAGVAPALVGFLVGAVGWPVHPSVMVAVLITCLPWGDAAAVSNTEFAIWPLLAILLLTTPARLSASLPASLASAAWRMTIIWSTPLCVVCLPIWVMGFIRERRTAARAGAYGCLLLSTALYAWFGIRHDALSVAGGHAVAIGGVLCTALKLLIDKSLLALLVRGVLRINPAPVGCGAALSFFRWRWWPFGTCRCLVPAAASG